VFPNAESKELVEAYASGEINKSLILHGRSGCGKSLLQELIPNAIVNSTARLQKVRCADIKNASDVHNHYNKNKQFNHLFKDNERYNYIIIEEFLITNQRISDAFKIELDKSRGVDMTIISTNQFNKIDVGIVSRSLELELVACEPKQFFNHAKNIFDRENMHIEDQVLMKCLDVTYALQQDNRKYYDAIDALFRKL
jgi:replication-associated recombination protein RarA